MSTSSPKERIGLAQLATRRCDELMWQAIEALTDAASGPGNGAGVYPDPGRVKSKMITAKTAIAQAHQIALNTEWPSTEDYDQC